MFKILKASALALATLLALAGPAAADSGCRYIRTGAVLTAGQWNECFAAKQDALNYVPLNRAGGTMLGPLITAPSTAPVTGLRVPAGTAPTTPVDGDVWTTTAGLFVRINGVTIGPLSGGTSSSFSATSPIVVTFPSGVVNYAFDFSVANTWTGVQTFTNSTIRLLGSSTGYTTFASANSSATNYTATFPANTGTVAELNLAQTWSAVQSFADSNLALNGSTSGNLVLRAAAISATSIIRFPAGSTDFSATGGTSQVVKQTGAGGPFTVARLACSDLSDSASGCSASAITALTGDVTATGPGSVAATLATAQPAVHTWALAQTFTVAPVFTDASGSRSALGLGSIATQAASSVAITGGTIAGLTGLAIRDTSAAFDVTIAATSSSALTAGRTLTLNVQNVAHILTLGTTASTGSGIIFPNTATDTVATLGVANAFTGNNSFAGTSLFTGTSPSLSNGNAAVAASATLGGIFTGKGSSKDITIANGAGSTVCDVATGTTTINCATLTLTNRLTSASIDLATNATIGVMRGDTTTISCTAGVCTAVGAAATSISNGTTTVASGTDAYLLYNNAGTLGNRTVASVLTAGPGIAITGTTTATIARVTPVIASCVSGLTCDATSRTYTLTNANARELEIILVGGGGGGGPSGTISVGAGAGGATCIALSGSACSSPVYQAGGGAAGAQSGSGTAGGTVSGSGTCNVASIAGGSGDGVGGLVGGIGGTGGSSSLGGGGGGTFGANAPSGAANTGGGGGGSGNTDSADGSGGGAGATCRVIITSPAASYTYQSGAGGTGASSGSAFNGGSGGTGNVIFIER